MANPGQPAEQPSHAGSSGTQPAIGDQPAEMIGPAAARWSPGSFRTSVMPESGPDGPISVPAQKARTSARNESRCRSFPSETSAPAQNDRLAADLQGNGACVPQKRATDVRSTPALFSGFSVNRLHCPRHTACLICSMTLTEINSRISASFYPQTHNEDVSQDARERGNETTGERCHRRPDDEAFSASWA